MRNTPQPIVRRRVWGKRRPADPGRPQVSRALLVAALSLCIAAAGFAQSTNSSDLRGTVTDSTGAVIPGAKVTIINTETGVVTDLTTNDAGIYDSVSIRPGKYKVTFSQRGLRQTGARRRHAGRRRAQP